MGSYGVKLPDVGEGVAEAEVVLWMVAVGESVRTDQAIAEVMTDKASVEIYTPVAGTVEALNGQPGDFIAVGSDLLTLTVDGHVSEAASTPSAPTALQNPTPGPAVSGTSSTRQLASPPSEPVQAVPRARGARPLASPAVRKRARDNWVNLVDVPGSGPAGRIIQVDLDLYLAGGAKSQPPEPQGAPAATPNTPFSTIPGADSAEVRVIGLRRRIARQMAESKRRIPHFSYVEEVDVTTLEVHRGVLNSEASSGSPKLTVLPFLIAALAVALGEHPEMNARFDDEAGVIHRYDNLHCGIAAQTPNGLVVPVVRNAEALDVWELASEISRLAEGARSGNLEAHELRGASITISSLGPLGGLVSTPVINHPEVAILGVNKIVERPVVVAGEIVIRKMMNLSGSFDHRAVDGMDAALFVQRIKAELENSETT
jgi:2-oxoisovalerate dehydrogenase E2 component (dihydrolipoyl transacylase)